MTSALLTRGSLLVKLTASVNAVELLLPLTPSGTAVMFRGSLWDRLRRFGARDVVR